ncbi:MAG: ATP-binding protein [Asgard group archaeon]|nr:ATP-binding protein [Asgard group archaeon]
MKDSKNRYNKKRNPSYSSDSEANERITKSWIKSIISYIVTLIVGLTAFFFLFPELISKIFPSFSLASSSFITKLRDALSTPLLRVILSIGLIILLILVLWNYSPYVITSNKEVFCQRKVFFPFFCKVSSILLVSQVESDNTNRQYYAFKIHESFSQSLAFNISHIQMAISNFESIVSIYFILTLKGFVRKNLVKRIQKNLLFLSNSLNTYYDSSSEILTFEQTRLLFQNLKEMKIKNQLDISSTEEIDLDVPELLYKTISNENLSNITLLLDVKREKKKSTNFFLQLHSLSNDKQTLEYFTSATGFTKKHRISRVKKRLTILSEKLKNYLHLPFDYQGSVFVLQPRRKKTSQHQQSVLLGYEYKGILTDEIFIDVGELLYNVEIYGMIGRGKTRLVSSMIDQLISFETPCLIFDIKGEYAATFVDDPNVEIYTIGEPHPLCINLFDTKDEDDVRSTLLIIEEMMVTSNQEFSASMKNLFETALFLTHTAVERTLETYVEKLITLAKETRHIASIQHTLDAVLNRLNFIFNPISFEILGVKENNLDFELLEKGKSIILDLSQFQKRAARPSDIYLVCNLILKMFYRYVNSKNNADQGLQYVVVLEEAVNIIPQFYNTPSSATLITAENNFLLGRSLGIGHITVSQLWTSVSNIVHGNSSTKIVFRSGQGVEKIADALNLQEEQHKRIQQLPIRNCFVWIDGQDQAIEMTTADFTLNPLNYTLYIQILKRKYPSFVYPKLYNSFIDMRTTLYANLSKQTNQNKKRKSNINKKSQNKEIKGKSPTAEKTSTKPSTEVFSKEKQEEKDDICDTFCSSNRNKEACISSKKNAQLISSIILKRYSSFEIEQAILGNSHTTIEDLLNKVILEKKLENTEQVLFCSQRELTNHLMSKDLS